MAAQIRSDPAPIDALLHRLPDIGIGAQPMDEQQAPCTALPAFAMPKLHILRSRPAQNGSRSRRLATLPGPVFGSCSFEKSAAFGLLWRAILPRQKAMISSALAEAPSRNTQIAFTASPHCASGTPIAAP